MQKPEASKTDAPKPDAPKPDGIKAAGPNPAAGPAAPKADAPKDPIKAEPGKTEPGKADPAKPGTPGAEPRKPEAPGAGPRPAGAAVTDGPIIDLKAKRIPDPAEAAKPAAGAPSAAKPDAVKPGQGEPPKPAPAASPTPKTAPQPEPQRGAGFGSIAAAGLIGGVIGAGLLFGADRGGLLGPRDDSHLSALEQRVSGQIAGLAPRDAVAALDKRVAANEAALKPLPEAVKNADSTAKQALAQATGGAAGGEGNAAQGLPPDIVSRLDSLDQRVAALQEEPGKEPAADQKAGGAQTADLAALGDRVKALESAGDAKPAQGQGDVDARLAALQGDVESRTKANAEADQALGQRLDALQKALDERVKAATEAVQNATQASQQAAEAGRVQAQEAAKTAERGLQDQAEKIAALDKALAQRAQATTVQAALRVVAADRIATALATGAPYAEPLATLRKLETGDTSRVDALAPFAETGAPSAAQLAAEFRPIAEKAAAARRSAQARTVAESGDLKAKFLSMADSIVQVRRVDAPPASGTEPEADPLGKIQAALDRGAIQEAAKSFDAMPDAARAEAASFGQRLKARAAAAQASQALLSDAFKTLPAGQ
ncbi:COG4223 family protein [Methylobacterium dankookense]|uniref:COG4223 family protein n=1 Tax=Methylobacterium dankookense TaxID=560405 RepID=UPI001EDE6635|nr:translation initiation factor 2 [Methylobacterium dankookense]